MRVGLRWFSANSVDRFMFFHGKSWVGSMSRTRHTATSLASIPALAKNASIDRTPIDPPQQGPPQASGATP